MDEAKAEEATRRFIWAFFGMTVDEFCQKLIREYNPELYPDEPCELLRLKGLDSGGDKGW